jgi:ABC-type nitrate/sulfonate/bicarbonate transport system permease component
VRRVVLPTTLPYAMTGFRLGATVAMILTITGELIIVTGLLGAALNLATKRVERRMLHWHQSARTEVSA